jgi:hypothetical protein
VGVGRENTQQWGLKQIVHNGMVIYQIKLIENQNQPNISTLEKTMIV